MKRFLTRLLLCASLIAVSATAAAQHGGGPPGGGGGHGGFGGPGGPGGPGGGPGGMGGLPPSGGGNGGGGGNTEHSRSPYGPAGRWWDDSTVIQSVGLRKDQQKKMDAIFNSRKAAIISGYKALLSEQAKLDKLNSDPKADRSALFAQIDAVNQSRAALQKTTTEMLLEIRQQLDPDQIARLEKLQ